MIESRNTQFIIMLSLSLIISLFVLFIPLGFSPDSLNYAYFLKYPEANTNVILKLLSYLIDNYNYLNFFYSLIFLVLFSYIFKKMSAIPLLSFGLLLILNYLDSHHKRIPHK